MSQKVYGIARGIQRVQFVPEAASQSFKKGHILTLNSSGQCQRHATSGNRAGAASGITLRPIGIALADASGTANTPIPVIVAEPGTQFLLPCHHATAASAVPNQANIGSNYEIIHVAAGYDAVSLDNTTNTKVKIVGMHTDDYPGWPTGSASAEQYGAVWVEFLYAQCGLGAGY